MKDEEVKAIVSNGIISLQFNKQFERPWPNLFHAECENKELLRKIREDAIKHAGERAERLRVEKRDEQAKNKKEALKEQMKIEEEERKFITQIKETEKLKATKEIEQFKQISRVPAIPHASNNLSSCSSESESESVQEKKAIFERQPSHNVEVKKEDLDLPAPRSASTIQIKFTPRVFPTPCRESTDKQEREVTLNAA